MELTISRRALAVALAATSKDNHIPGLQRVNFHETGGISATNKYVLVTVGDCSGEIIAAIDKTIIRVVIADAKRAGRYTVVLDTEKNTLGAYLYDYDTGYMQAPIYRLMSDALRDASNPDDTCEFAITEPVFGVVYDAIKAYRAHTPRLPAKGNTQTFTHLTKNRWLCQMPGDDNISLLFMAAITKK